MLFDQKSFFRILRQKIQQASQNRDLDQEIRSVFDDIETNLGDLDFNGNDGFTNGEEMLLKILDEELNNLFGYVGYSLLQLGKKKKKKKKKI